MAEDDTPEEENGEDDSKEDKKEKKLTVKQAVADLKAANDAMDAELLRAEQLRAKVALGGKAEAGQKEKEKEPETDEEFTKRFEEGQIDLASE